MQSTLQNQSAIPELIPVSKWNEYFQFPSVGALRQYIFYGHKNGFNKVIRRMGKRIYICVSDFKSWVDSNSGERAC